ncbi:hypothetical protein [Zhongshania borealis]|uniref:hypothetical protein n=1 Tax=Zhongshania borealis TaxID=889488 RepID=UPI0031E84C39
MALAKRNSRHESNTSFSEFIINALNSMPDTVNCNEINGLQATVSPAIQAADSAYFMTGKKKPLFSGFSKLWWS